jgi:hypothetical protein
MPVKDGRLEVALAIARTSDLVTVVVQPLSVDPSDLFDRAFNNNKVGIDDGQMSLFKAELERLLPEITTDIDRIPENANQIIEDVAEFVRLALLKSSA